MLPMDEKFKYKYNGKELQDELGLNWYDYGARNYQADLGRWFSPDPLSEEFSQWSPYHYALNNPVFKIDKDGRKGEDWFVNKKTGALVYIQGEHKLNKETAEKAFGKQQADVIFNNDKNNYQNWERLGDDTMFDTPDNKVSENGTDFKPESVAEDFANSKGYSIAIKTDVTEEINSQYFNDSDDNSMSVIHNDPVEKKIHNQSYTYAKEESEKIVSDYDIDISGVGWDKTKYRVIKIEKGRVRDFSGSNRIHKIKGPIDIQNEKK